MQSAGIAEIKRKPERDSNDQSGGDADQDGNPSQFAHDGFVLFVSHVCFLTFTTMGSMRKPYVLREPRVRQRAKYVSERARARLYNYRALLHCVYMYLRAARSFARYSSVSPRASWYRSTHS